MSFLAIPMLTSQKPLQKGGFGQKCSFFATIKWLFSKELILRW